MSSGAHWSVGVGSTTGFGSHQHRPAQLDWYEIGCDVRSAKPTRDGVFLKVDCEKGGGAKGSGDIDIRRVGPTKLDVYVSPMTFSGELRYALRLCKTPDTVKAGTGGWPTRWKHNGSTLTLVAQGTSREFYYEQPRPGIIAAGARRGSLLFKGEIKDGSYEGLAFFFNRKCGQQSYSVSGPILDGFRRVVLRGQVPKVNEQCQVTGYRTDTLEFDLIDP